MLNKKNTWVIILNYNGAKYLVECLATLTKSTRNIILVDNNSTDASFVWAQKKYPNLTYIPNKENYGFAKGNNIGIKYALTHKKAEAVALLNFDTEVDKNWLDELIALTQIPTVGIVQSKIYLYKNTKTRQFNTTGNNVNFLGFGFCNNLDVTDHGQFDEITEIASASGAAMLITREVFQKIGYLKEEFFAYLEDQDFSVRTRLAGFKVLYAPDSVVWHKYHFARNKKKFYWSERNRWMSILANYQLKTLIILFPMLVLSEIGMYFYALLDGWFFEKILSSYGVLQNYQNIKNERQKIQSKRVISDKILFKSMISDLNFEPMKRSYFKLINPVLWIYKKLTEGLL